MLPLPQMLSFDSAPLKGEAMPGKGFGADAQGAGGGFAALLGASQPQQAATNRDAPGGEPLPATGKALPPSGDTVTNASALTASEGSIEVSLTKVITEAAPGTIKLPGSAVQLPANSHNAADIEPLALLASKSLAVPVTGPIKLPVTLPGDLALTDFDPETATGGLDIAALANRMTQLAGPTQPIAVAFAAASAAHAAQGNTGSAAANRVAVPVTVPATVALRDVALNNLPDALTASIVTPALQTTASQARLTAAAGLAATPANRPLPPDGTLARRFAELEPDLMKQPGDLPGNSLRAAGPIFTASQASGPGTGAVTSEIAALQRMRSPQALPADAVSGAPAVARDPLATASAGQLTVPVVRPELAAQNMLRGANSTPVLTNSPQGAAAARVVHDALQLSQTAALTEPTALTLPTPPRAESPQPATPYAPLQLDLAAPGGSARRGAPVTTSTLTTSAGATAAALQVDAPDLLPAASKPDAQFPILPQPSITTLTAPTSTALPAAPTAAQSLSLPVTDNAWGNALSERVVVLAGQKLTSADIRLNPAELGPLRVEINVDDGKAQIHFTAQHAVTREAIEQALPRLRELLASEGLNLTGADVSEHGVSRDSSEQAESDQGGAFAADDASSAEADNDDRTTAARDSDGLVDTFA